MKKNLSILRNSLINTNIIKLLLTFSKSENREFGKFVLSPFHNNRSELIPFWDEIKKYYPAYNSENLSLEKIYSKLYPGKKLRADVIRRLSSNLFKLAEEYLAYKYYRQEEFNYSRNLMEQYYERDLEKNYLKQYANTKDILEKSTLRNAEYYERTRIIEETHRYHLSKSDTTAKKTDVQKQIDSMWQYAIITLLRLYTNAAQYIDQFNRKYDINNLKHLLAIVESSEFKKSDAVEIFYQSYKIMTDARNDETFYKLKNLLKNNRYKLNNIEKDMLYISLLTYCWKMNVKTGKDYSKDEFEFIVEMLKDGILSDGETIYSEWFMYAFLTATKAGEIKFAEEFIIKYGGAVPVEQRHNVINHAYAELELIKKNYEKALSHLALPKYNNVSEKLRANNMYLKIYYELGRSEQFFYNVDSFNHLLKSETSLSASTKAPRKNFVKYILKLYRLKLGETKADLGKLKDEIESSNVVHNKWLLEKTDELQNLYPC